MDISWPGELRVLCWNRLGTPHTEAKHTEHCSSTPHKGSEPTTGSVYLSRNREEEISEVSPKTKTGACHWSPGHFGVLGATWSIQTQSHCCTQACPAYRSKLWPLGPFGMSPTSQSPAGICMELVLLPVGFSSYIDCPHHGCPYLSDRSHVSAPFVSISVGWFSMHRNMSSSEAGGQPEPHSLDRAL